MRIEVFGIPSTDTCREAVILDTNISGGLCVSGDGQNDMDVIYITRIGVTNSFEVSDTFRAVHMVHNCKIFCRTNEIKGGGTNLRNDGHVRVIFLNEEGKRIGKGIKIQKL